MTDANTHATPDAPALHVITRDVHGVSRKQMSQSALRVLYRLQEAGFVVQNDEGYAVNGALIECVCRAIVEGFIKVKVE